MPAGVHPHTQRDTGANWVLCKRTALKSLQESRMKSISRVILMLVVSLTVFGPRISRGKVLPKRVDLLLDRGKL